MKGIEFVRFLRTPFFPPEDWGKRVWKFTVLMTGVEMCYDKKSARSAALRSVRLMVSTVLEVEEEGENCLLRMSMHY
jgi:hypothetical protein